MIYDKFSTLPNWKSLLEDNFKFDENAVKFRKWVKNTVGKGEIARIEQFLLIPVLSKDLYWRHIKPGLVWEKVKSQLLCCLQKL